MRDQWTTLPDVEQVLSRPTRPTVRRRTPTGRRFCLKAFSHVARSKTERERPFRSSGAGAFWFIGLGSRK